MILKASQRGGGKQLAAHLLNTRANDHVTVHQMCGFVASDLKAALNEASAVSLGTKCKQYLFSVSLNPPADQDVPISVFEQAISEIEKRNKLVGHPRAIVFHEKEGRRHAHCVWSRINVEKMKAVNLSHFKLKLRELSRELYLENDWQLPSGLMNSEARDPLNFDLDEWQQALRAKVDPKELKAMFAECWAASDGRQSFEAFLRERGYILARGDRRGFVAVDWRGEVYSLSRWIGKKTKELNAQLGTPDACQSVNDAKAIAEALRARREGEFRALIEKQKTDIASRRRTALRKLIAEQREARRLLHEKQQARLKELRRENQKKLPTGLKALWFRLSGEYERRVEENRSAFERECMRQSEELDALTTMQLDDRRELSLKYQQQKLELSKKLSTSFTIKSAEIKYPRSRRNLQRL